MNTEKKCETCRYNHNLSHPVACATCGADHPNWKSAIEVDKEKKTTIDSSLDNEKLEGFSKNLLTKEKAEYYRKNPNITHIDR